MTIVYGSQEFGNYLDLDDVKNYLNVPASDTSKDYQLRLIVDSCCGAIQRYIGGPIQPQSFTWVFDGWSTVNGSYVMLPYYPVLEVTSVIEWQGVAGPFTLPLSTFGTGSVDGYQIVPETGRINRVFPGNVQKPFWPGSRNVEVTWVAGYNPLPPEIVAKTLTWVRILWHEEQQQTYGIGTGNNVDTTTAAPGASMWAGIPNFMVPFLAPFVCLGMA